MLCSTKTFPSANARQAQPFEGHLLIFQRLGSEVLMQQDAKVGIHILKRNIGIQGAVLFGQWDQSRVFFWFENSWDL